VLGQGYWGRSFGGGVREIGDGRGRGRESHKKTLNNFVLAQNEDGMCLQSILLQNPLIIR
jgi:hypothetical protein